MIFYIVVFLCGGCFSEESLSSLPQIIDSFLKVSPEKKSIDEQTVFAAHKHFIDLLDPNKEYFLQNEVDEFLDLKKEEKFIDEIKNGSFRSYIELTKTFQKAVRRACEIRSRFCTMSPPSFKNIVVNQKKLHSRSFARDKNELQEKILQNCASLIQAKMASSKEISFHQAVTDVEKDLKREEEKRAEALFTRENELAQSILKSLLNALDCYSDVLVKKDARVMREKLTKEAFGTGIICGFSKNLFYIEKIQQGSPASERKVVREGDILISIDRKPCSSMTIDEVDGLLRDKKEGSVHLVGERQERTFEADVPARSFILNEDRVQGRISKTSCGTLLVISVPVFYGNEHGVSASDDIEKCITEHKRQGKISGIILDFRENGGGYVSEAVKTCGLFLKTGVVMMVLCGDGGTTVYRDTDAKLIYDGPMVILTSKMTASAAEIVTQVLKDYGKAIVVGAKNTFGKGSIQMQTITDEKRPEAMPVKYTVGKFYSVSGISPNGKGVESDISLPELQEGVSSSQVISVASLPETLSPRFHDTLVDIAPPSRPWYEVHYIPFIQQKEERYRRLIPMLRKKSQERVCFEFPDSIIHSHAKNYAEKKVLEDALREEQMQETQNILIDLISNCKNLNQN